MLTMAHSSNQSGIFKGDGQMHVTGSGEHAEYQAKQALLSLLNSSDMVSLHQAVLCYTKAYMVEVFNLKHGQALPCKRQFI